MTELNNDTYVLGIDISTKTLGISLFKNLGDRGELQHLQHVSPNVKPKPKSKLEELILKADLFEQQYLNKLAAEYKGKITRVIIEEPLLRSTNVNTVATLLRYNMLVCDSVYNILGLVPELISSYDARAYGFPELMSIRTHNKKGVRYSDKEIQKKIDNNELTLFGSYPWDVDKKEVIYNKVADLEPLIQWKYNKKKMLSKENFDMTDSYVCVRGFMNKIGEWPIVNPEL